MKKIAFLFLLATSYVQAQQFCSHAHTHDGCLQHQMVQTALPGPAYDITYNRCFWEVNPTINAIKGKIDYHFKPLATPFNQFNIELAAPLIVDSIFWHGQLLTTSRSVDILTANLPSNLSINNIDSLTIHYHGTPVSTGFGSYHVGVHGTAPIIWTFSVPYGGKDWWPCKLALDDKIDSIDIFVKNPAQYRAGSNGKLISDAISGGHRISHWKHRYPITSYLVAFAVSNYAAYSDQAFLTNGTQLPILNYVYPEDSLTAVNNTPALVQVLEFYDSLFAGYPYPAEKYGHCQFGWGGGMEHQTMSFVTDFDIDLLAHELAHQWFGDKVTEASYVDCWLSEGFATYLTGLTTERFYHSRWQTWKQNALNNITSSPGGSVYVTDTTNVWRIYNSQLSYDKGAYLLHMLRWKLGEQAFFDGVRNYVSDPRFAYGYARTADLQRHLEITSGQNLTQFFNEWFIGEGFPKFTLNWWQDNNGQVSTYLSQTTSAPSSVTFFHVPVPIRVSNGVRDTVLVIEHQSNGQYTGFNVPFQITTVQIDPQLWLVSRQNRIILGNESLSVTDNQQLLLFPNPTQELLQIKYETTKNGSAFIYVYDVSGKLCLTKKAPISSGENTIPLDVKELPNGSYQLVFKSKGVSLTGKFVKHE
jgi:aminopeptidase N